MITLHTLYATEESFISLRAGHRSEDAKLAWLRRAAPYRPINSPLSDVSTSAKLSNNQPRIMRHSLQFKGQSGQVYLTLCNIVVSAGATTSCKRVQHAKSTTCPASSLTGFCAKVVHEWDKLQHLSCMAGILPMIATSAKLAAPSLGFLVMFLA